MFIRNDLLQMNTLKYACLNRPMLVAAGLALALVACSSSVPDECSTSVDLILEGRAGTGKEV